jgi:hypothetical protein
MRELSMRELRMKSLRTIASVFVAGLAGAGAAVAGTEAARPEVAYYGDPMLFIDGGVAGAAASAKLQEFRAYSDGASDAKVVSESAVSGPPLGAASTARRSDALEYFPDSHVDLDYFPHDSTISHFPESR